MLDKITNEDLLKLLKGYYSSEENILAFIGSDDVEYPIKEAVVALRNSIEKTTPKAYEEEVSDKKLINGKQTSLSVEVVDYSEGLGGNSILSDVETLFNYLAFTKPRFEENALQLIEQSLQSGLTAKENNVKSDFSDSLQLALSNYSLREVLKLSMASRKTR